MGDKNGWFLMVESVKNPPSIKHKLCDLFLVGGWTNPFEKYESKWESSPNFRGEHQKYLSCHHLVLGKTWVKTWPKNSKVSWWPSSLGFPAVYWTDATFMSVSTFQEIQGVIKNMASLVITPRLPNKNFGIWMVGYVNFKVNLSKTTEFELMIRMLQNLSSKQKRRSFFYVHKRSYKLGSSWKDRWFHFHDGKEHVWE